MRENSKFALLIASLHVALLLVVIGMQTPKASATVRNPGVNVGFWADYFAEINGTTQSVPQNFTATLKTTVQAISGTNITFEGLVNYYYQNGTVQNQNQTLFVDVDSGKGNGTMWFTAANLNASDLVYTNPDYNSQLPPGTTINETITKNYLGSDAQINHVNLTRKMDLVPPDNYNYSQTFNFYWYHTTGALAEVSWEVTAKNQTANQWISEYIIITGIVPEFPPTLIVPLILIIPLITVLFRKALPVRWRLKHKQ